MVSSSNNLGYSEQDMAQILENDAAVKEMEGAAIAWAAHLFKVPVLALKSITDIVDGDRPPQEEFLENLQKAALALKASLLIFPIDGDNGSAHILLVILAFEALQRGMQEACDCKKLIRS